MEVNVSDKNTYSDILNNELTSSKIQIDELISQEDVVFERTQLKLPDEFCVIMNPKAEYYCLTIQCQETINR